MSARLKNSQHQLRQKNTELDSVSAEVEKLRNEAHELRQQLELANPNKDKLELQIQELSKQLDEEKRKSREMVNRAQKFKAAVEESANMLLI